MNTNPMTPPSAGGVAGVLEVLRRDQQHAAAYRLAHGYADGSLAEAVREADEAIRTVEAMAGALKLAVRQNSHDMLMTGEEIRECEQALAAIESAAPAGDGEMQYVGIVVEAPNGGLAISTPAAPAGGGASGADEGDIEAIAAEVELLFANPGNDGGDARRLADRIRRLASTGSAQSEPQRVECRECGECGHVGINDLSLTDDACGDCGWSGPAPTEDKCPECSHENCMGAACPGCGSRYRLIAESELPATGSAPAPSAWRPIESAPKDGRVVLLVRTGWPAYSGRWHNGDWTDAEDAIRYPEFWMPVPTLPAAPTQEPPRKTSRVYETEARIEPFLKKEPTP